MKWTAENDAKLLELARDGVDDATAGRCFGVSGSAVYQRVRIRHGIIMKRASAASRVVNGPPVVGLRDRWAVLIGPMKQKLRASIGGI